MEKRFSLEDIMEMERFFRRDFLNTVSGYRSCQLIGTQSHRQIPNLGLFNSVAHIGANPPLLGFVLRPLTVPRHTYHNIKAQGCFTLNQVAQSFYEKAHQASAKYAEEVSEFEAVGLQPQYSDAHSAPYVLESPIKLGLELEEEHHIQANGTLFIVGKVVEILIDSRLLAEDGHVLLEKGKIVSVAGLDSYYAPKLLSRLSYARPGQAVTKLKT